MAYHSVNGLIDYQDEAYAEKWLACLVSLIDRDEDRSGYSHLTKQADIWPSGWLEDIPRVAQLKVRPDREDQIRSEVKADAAQPMAVAEFFHPRVEEIAALMPRRWGAALLRSETVRSLLGRVLGPRTLELTVLPCSWYFAACRVWYFRRSTLGYTRTPDDR